jgi:hypothetical protein
VGKSDFTAVEWAAITEKPVGAVPQDVRERLRWRLEKHRRTAAWRELVRHVDVTFRGGYVYLEAWSFAPPEHVIAEYETSGFRGDWELPWRLCRLGWTGDENAWLFAFYRYSNEKYNPHLTNDGSLRATPEQAFDDAAEVYFLM